MSNNHNRNHNRNNSNIQNHDDHDSESEILFDETKEIEEEDSSSDDGANEQQQTTSNPQYAMFMPSFINARGTRYRVWDEQVHDVGLSKVIDVASSLAEYQQVHPQDDYKENTDRLQSVMDRLLNVSKAMRIEQLMFDRLTDEVRNGALDDDQKQNGQNESESQSQSQSDSTNPAKTGDWGSYFESARTALTTEIDSGQAREEKAAAIKQFFRIKVPEYKQQFEDAIQCDDIEDYDSDHNRNHNGGGRGGGGEGMENEVDSGEESDDEDIVIENNRNKDISAGSVKCPLTKAVFQHPVKSKVCSHTFERAAIEQYLASKKNSTELAECPLPGCSNILNEDQMVRDVQMERMVKAASKQGGDRDSDEDDGCFDMTAAINTQ